MGAREKAWATRRARYGAHGHAGAYRCGVMSCEGCGARRMVIRLYVEGTLSEGQAAKALGMDRVVLRGFLEGRKEAGQ